MLLTENIRTILNKEKIVSVGMNMGIVEAKGKYVLRLDGHSTIDEEYLERSVEVLKTNTGVAGVGGVVSPVGRTLIGEAIAGVYASILGSGGAAYRRSSESNVSSVDTIWCGCWRKKDLLRIGCFNEKWVKNQDYELNIRLKENIGKLVIDPEIRASYFVRNTFDGLITQYFKYGFWRLKNRSTSSNFYKDTTHSYTSIISSRFVCLFI